MMNGAELFFSFIGGCVLAALVAFFLVKSSIRARVAQARQQSRDEMERLKLEKAGIEKDLEYAGEKIQQLEKRSEEAGLEAQQQLQTVKDEAAKALQVAKDEAAKALETAKEESVKVLAESKEELHKRYQEELDARSQAHKEAMEALQARFDETIKKVSAQVKEDTGEMLKSRQKEFSESSTQSLGQIVTPLKEHIAELKKAMEESGKEQAGLKGEMRQQIQNLMVHSDAARKSADELAAAFKHGSKVQGDWGETILSELLKAQGLTEGVHFDTQAVIRGADGKAIHNETGGTLRPDIILHLDERREVIIDSKVSLTAYVDYVNAENEQERQIHLKAHIDSLQKHVKELSGKDYSSYIQPPKVSAGYVIMFVPNAGALWTALNAEPSLWRKAADANVYIADEQSLYAALKIVSMTWTQVVQAQNHERVYELANEMIERVGLFMEKYDAIGRALEKAGSEYEDGKKKLLPQGQSIINTSNKLIKLGAKNSDKHPVRTLVE